PAAGADRRRRGRSGRRGRRGLLRSGPGLVAARRADPHRFRRRSALGLAVPLAVRCLEDQLMRAVRVLSAALLALGLAAAPAAADSSPSPEASRDDGAPTRAGTSFRTATEVEQGQTATARASTGDYLYWSFPADAGQRPTVRATVQLPERHAAETWQIDVYDGLRRRQACQYGAQTRTAGTD